MIFNNRVLGAPLVVYAATKTEIQSINPQFPGAIAYTTDTHEFAFFNGSSWVFHSEAGGSGGHTIQDEGTPLTARSNLNFVGASVTVTDDSGNDATVVTITGASVTWANNETPSGTINGINTSFSLAHTPNPSWIQLYLNGVILEPGAGNDYTLSGTSITMLFAPETGDKLRAYYMY